MGSISIAHWLMVLAVVLLLFGTKRLRGAGRDLGEAIKGFKKGISDADAAPAELNDQSRSNQSSEQPQHSSEHAPR